MKNLYIVRHAKAEGQPFAAPLTNEGKTQALQLVDFFKDKDIDSIYSSPFTRAIETIRPLSAERVLEIKEDERLSERVLSSENFPDWKEKLQQSFIDFNLAFNGGESSQDGFDRARSMIEEVMDTQDQHIVLVSHGNLTTLLLKCFDGVLDMMN